VVDLARPPQGDQSGQLVGARVDRVDAQFARRAGDRGGLDDGAGGGPGIGQVGERPGGQVVDDVDRLALDDEPVDEVGADEPGPADDEDGPLRVVGEGRVVGAFVDVRRDQSGHGVTRPVRELWCRRRIHRRG
jgi:hypothetical protein